MPGSGSWPGSSSFQPHSADQRATSSAERSTPAAHAPHSALVWSLLLPLLGFCALANKFNLRLQCATTLIKFFSVDSEVLRAMMSNAFLMFSEHAYHAKAADDGLETKQGYVKPKKKWSVREAVVNTACEPLFSRVRAQWLGPRKKAGSSKPTSLKADVDIEEITTRLGPYRLYDFDPAAPRKMTSLSTVQHQSARLVSNPKTKLPQAWIRPFHPTREILTENQPVLQRAHAEMAKIFELMPRPPSSPVTAATTGTAPPPAAAPAAAAAPAPSPAAAAAAPSPAAEVPSPPAAAVPPPADDDLACELCTDASGDAAIRFDPTCELCAVALGDGSDDDGHDDDGVEDCEDRECSLCHAVVCHRPRCWAPSREGIGLCGVCAELEDERAMDEHRRALELDEW